MGDVMWSLANILWRIYAEVHLLRTKICWTDESPSGNSILKQQNCRRPSPPCFHTKRNDSRLEAELLSSRMFARATTGEGSWVWYCWTCGELNIGWRKRGLPVLRRLRSSAGE